MAQLEYRSFQEVRQDAETGGFSGYASHFLSADSYLTAVKPGAYRKTLRERADKIPVLYSHNPEWNIGVPEVLKEDKHGLYAEARLFDDGAEGSVTLARLRQGARFGLSVGFQTVKDRAATKDDNLDLSQVKAKPEDIRVIEEIKLYEFSVVSFPANEAATIADVRQRTDLTALSTLLEDLRAGRLDAEDARAALLHQLADAWAARAKPEPDPDAGTTPLADAPKRRRDLDVHAAIALASLQGYLSV